MKNFSIVSLSLALFACLWVACDQVGVDPTGMGTTVILDQSLSATQPGEIQFEEGYLVIREIEFEGEKEDDNEIEVEIEQLTTLNLLTGETDPALPNLSIPAGRYEELELEVHSAEDGTILFLRGFFLDSTQQQIPLEIDIRKSFSLELEWENYEVDSTVAFGATFTIAPQLWFTGITLDELSQADQIGGVVIISPDNNQNLYAKLTDDLSEGIEWEWDGE